MKLTSIKKCLLGWTIVLCFQLNAQQTVGLFLNDTGSFNGYTLFAPLSSNTTYLIDNCGRKVHEWYSAYKPGASVYLLPNGVLLRTRALRNPNFNQGGSGGGVEMIDWNGKVIWDYTLSGTKECQHHDVAYLPNGNILILSWDAKTPTESDLAGMSIPAAIWSEKIVEIKPDLINGGGSIVWEWKVWDHLVQDFDSTKNNYGQVSLSPQLIHLNYRPSPGVDWLHINSVAYNAELDQIMMSVLYTNEIWIIDHSTTSLESAGHTGGKFGKGGDLLYRWGNPIAYNQGVLADQKLFGQHHATWIPANHSDAGYILLFNNRAGNPPPHSTINIINPPIDLAGNYIYTGGSFNPAGFYWTYKANPPADFYSVNISGVQRLPNGNTLICEGVTGRFFEINGQNEIVWEYINPVLSNGNIAAQGDIPVGNSVFRCERFSLEYSAFSGKVLKQEGYIETGSLFDCELNQQPPTALNEIESFGFEIYPNPSRGQLTLSFNTLMSGRLMIYNTGGNLVHQQIISEKIRTDVDFPVSLVNGIYFVQLVSDRDVFTGKVMLDRQK